MKFVALLLAIAIAPAADEAAAIEDLGRVQHPCVAQLSRSAGTARSPAQQVDDGLCLYAVGRYDQALETLSAALPPGGLPAAPDLTLVEAATVRVLLLARRNRGAEAQTRLAELQARLGPSHPQCQRAELAVVAAQAGAAVAWARAEVLWKAAPDSPPLVLALAELTSADPDAAPTWARAIIGRPSEQLNQYNRAIAQLTSGRYEECIAEIEGLLPTLDDEAALRRARLLGYRCAAHGGDLGAANRQMMALRDLPALDDQAVLAHADLLDQVGKTADALRLVELARVADRRAADTRLLRWNLALDRLDAALAVAEARQASPESRATLGLALHKQRREADARVVLASACPELEKGERRDCEALLAQLR